MLMPQQVVADVTQVVGVVVREDVKVLASILVEDHVLVLQECNFNFFLYWYIRVPIQNLIVMKSNDLDNLQTRRSFFKRMRESVSRTLIISNLFTVRASSRISVLRGIFLSMIGPMPFESIILHLQSRADA